MFSAVFKVSEVRQPAHDPAQRTIVLEPQVNGTDGRGRIEMVVDNPKAIEALPLGAFFSVEFTRVD
jgi:hypothetical protein